MLENMINQAKEGGNARVYHANGDALSPAELAAAREQLGEMA